MPYICKLERSLSSIAPKAFCKSRNSVLMSINGICNQEDQHWSKPASLKVNEYSESVLPWLWRAFMRSREGGFWNWSILVSHRVNPIFIKFIFWHVLSIWNIQTCDLSTAPVRRRQLWRMSVWAHVFHCWYSRDAGLCELRRRRRMDLCRWEGAAVQQIIQFGLLHVTMVAVPLASAEGMNWLRLTEGGLSGFSGAGTRESGSGSKFLGGGGGTTKRSGRASDPSSVMSGETSPENNFKTRILIRTLM